MGLAGGLQQVRFAGRTEGLQGTLERLASARAVERLWRKDPSLWSEQPAVQQTIANRLGWLTIGRILAPQAPSLQAMAEQLLASGIRQVALLGMGGSGLFPEVCRNLLGGDPPAIDLFVLDTTDPTAIRAQIESADPRHLAAIVSSKSGSTSEISALSKYVYEFFKAFDGRPGDHLLVITDAGTPLEAQAKRWGCRALLVHGAGTGSDVGGRFSALTYFGLAPAALLGVPLERLLDRAEAMAARCQATRVPDNPALELAAALGACARDGRDKLTLLMSSNVASFGTWIEQLVAESLGKLGQGVVPITGEPVQVAGSYGRDRVFFELQLAAEPDQALERHVDALISAGHPVIRCRWQDRYDLGGEVMKWEAATALLGHLFGINPFDEPNVTESKERTAALLSAYRDRGRLPEDAPLLAEDPRLAQGLAAFLKGCAPPDYCAVLSFLPRTAGLDAGVLAIRAKLGAALGVATMAQFGPRYLHSTGQLFKGGPMDRGRFLLLTADETRDLPIPGESFSFGVLKQAQALGDFQAMQQHGRRILRVHLGPQLSAAMPQLISQLEAALSLPASS